MKKQILSSFLSFSLLLPFLFGIAGCARNTDSNAQILHVYNWEDYICNEDSEEDGYVDLIAKFEEENPGVTVEYSTFGTNENMYNELKIGGGA